MIVDQCTPSIPNHNIQVVQRTIMMALILGMLKEDCADIPEGVAYHCPTGKKCVMGPINHISSGTAIFQVDLQTQAPTHLKVDKTISSIYARN